MAKAAIPRFLVPLLILGTLAGAAVFLAGKGGSPDAPTAGSPDQPDEPPKPKRAERPDVDLWEKWNGKPMSEILATLAPPKPSVDPTNLVSLDAPPAGDTATDPFLPRFVPVPGVALPPAASAAVIDGSFVLSSDGNPLNFWKIDGNPTEEIPPPSGLAGMPGGRRLLPADFDRDGDVDLFIGRGGDLPDSLLRRGNDGAWEDITEPAGLLEFLDLADAAWVDFDRDGWLDLCVAQRPPKGSGDSPVRLYHNQSGKTFTDIAKAAGLEIRGEVAGILWRDFDDDGYPELVLSLAGQPGALQWWRSVPGDPAGTRKFEDATAASGFQGIASSGPLAAGDLDGDGHDDLAVAADGKLTLLTTTPGAAPLFSAPSLSPALTGVAAPAVLTVEDIDRDGLPDLITAGGTEAKPEAGLWWNAGGLQFRSLSGSAGLETTAHLQSAVPLTGANSPLWLLTAGGNRNSTLRQLESPLITGRSRLAIRLQAPDSANRDGLGARITVTTRDRNWIFRSITVTTDEPEEVIGLDEAATVEGLEIVWPDRERSRSTFGKLPVNQRLEIGPGNQEIRQTPLP
jgi:hypothetical protein